MLPTTPQSPAQSNTSMPHGYNMTPEAERKLAPPLLLQYWNVIQRWRWIILLIVIGALVSGLVLTLIATPKYTAKARIEISREQKNVTKVDSIEPESAGRDLEFYATQGELLEARSVAERVARALHLSGDDTFFAANGVAPNRLAPQDRAGALLSTAARERRSNLAVDLLLAHVTVARVRGSSLFDVAYTSNSPALSARVANMWTTQFIQDSMDRRYASTADARKFLEDHLADLRAKLEESDRAAVNYAAQKNIVALNSTKSADGKSSTDQTLVATDLGALNEALAKATTDRIAAESHARQAGGRDSSTEAINNPTIASLRQKRAEVGAEYAKLLVQYEPGYPAARALNEQMRTLDAAIAREEGRVASTQSSAYREALQRENELKARVAALKGQLGTQQRDSIQYNIFQRDADTNRQLYDSLLQRYKEIDVAGVGANNIAIVDPALVPTGPSSPNLPRNLALAVLAGLAIAGVVVIALDQIDEGVREPGQVNRLLQIPLLGSVPDVESEVARDSLNDPKSQISEAYLSVRSNLAFSTDHGVPTSFIITSTRPGEGKSTTSLALAMVLARTGKKVALVDADMRSPSLHKFLGIPNLRGLSSYLSGDDAWQQLLVPTPNNGPFLMPSGIMPPSAAELLSSDRLRTLVKAMRQQFDHIVIDTPPVLGLADAPLLAGAVEGCIYVIEAEGVAVRGVKAALGRLESTHSRILGAIVTKIKRRQSGYGYGYGYGYSYDYGNEDR